MSEKASIQLQVGDRLQFYADGITEAANVRADILRIEPTIQPIETTRLGSLPEDLASRLVELKPWCGPVPVAD